MEEHANEHGIILDEFQHAPIILSYIQLAIDAEYKPGYFVLTGSQNFLLNEKISQTLAGRIALFTLLPLSIQELEQANFLPESAEEAIYQGYYPRIYDQHISPASWYPNYIRTYLERDVRQLKNVHDLGLFQKFIQLCAGRVGQPVNISSLANDCGITAITAHSWLSLLEASYLIFQLQPYYHDFSKRIIKTPKIFFYDVGLVCALLGIESAQQVYSHYLRGGLFENMIIADIMKHYYNRDKIPRVYFWQDKTGHEVDCVIEQVHQLIAVEIKAGKTIASDYFDGLEYWNGVAKEKRGHNFVVFADLQSQKKSQGSIVSWRQINAIFAA